MSTRESITNLAKRYPGATAIAHHEAGHIVAAAAFGYPTLAVEIDDKSRALSGTTWLVRTAKKPDLMRENLVIVQAGPAADRRFDRRAAFWLEHDKDKQDSLAIAWELVGRLGDESAVDAEIESARKAADKLIAARWAEVRRVVHALLTFHSVTKAIQLERTL